MIPAAGRRFESLLPRRSSAHSTSMSRKCDSPLASVYRLWMRMWSPRGKRAAYTRERCTTGREGRHGREEGGTTDREGRKGRKGRKEDRYLRTPRQRQVREWKRLGNLSADVFP